MTELTAAKQAINKGTWIFFENINDVYTDAEKEELIDLINDKEVKPGKGFISLLTFEQYQKIEGARPVGILLTKDGSLDDYVTVLNGNAPDSTYDLLFLKFWTEEEMLAHTELFNPEIFRKASIVYMSPQTLKILNKAHPKNGRVRSFRYKDSFSDFIQIVGARRFNKMPLSLKDIIYLKRKTNVTNTDFLKVITDSEYTYINKNAPELKPLIRLLKNENGDQI